MAGDAGGWCLGCGYSELVNYFEVKKHIGKDCPRCGDELIFTPGHFDSRSEESLLPLDIWSDPMIAMSTTSGYVRLIDWDDSVYTDPIRTDLQICIKGDNPGADSVEHHVLYNKTDGTEFLKQFSEYKVHHHPDVHDEIHMGYTTKDPKYEKKMSYMTFGDVKAYIGDRDNGHDYLVPNIRKMWNEAQDDIGWNNGNDMVDMKLMVTLINSIEMMWENMERSHDMYPGVYPDINQLWFGLLRIGFPPFFGLPRPIAQAYDVEGIRPTGKVRMIRDLWQKAWIGGMF
jgi:hypothetical protein